MIRLLAPAAAAALLLAAGQALAQDAAACPTVNVTGPSDTVAPGAPITFTVNVSGGDAMVTPTYNWTISASGIESGQGTPTISLSAPTEANSSVTATVDVGGYGPQCSTSASSTAMVGA